MYGQEHNVLALFNMYTFYWKCILFCETAIALTHN